MVSRRRFQIVVGFGFAAMFGTSTISASTLSIRRDHHADEVRTSTEVAPQATKSIITIEIDRGSASDPPNRSGLAHLSEHLLLSSIRHSTQSNCERVVTAEGTYLNGSTNYDRVRLIMTVAPSNLPSAIECIAGSLQAYPHSLDSRLFSDTRQEVLNELVRTVREEEYGIRSYLMLKTTYIGYAYSRLPGGDPSNVRAMTMGDVRAWWQSITDDLTSIDVSTPQCPSRDVDTAMREFSHISIGRVRVGVRETYPIHSERFPEMTTNKIDYKWRRNTSRRLYKIWNLPGTEIQESAAFALYARLLRTELSREFVARGARVAAMRVDLMRYKLLSQLWIVVRLGPGATFTEISSIVSRSAMIAAKAIGQHVGRQTRQHTRLPRNFRSSVKALDGSKHVPLPMQITANGASVDYIVNWVRRGSYELQIDSNEHQP